MGGPEPVPGWEAPVYEGMQEHATFAGVPFVFGAILAIITLGCLLWYYPLLVVCAVVYGLAAAATAIEPQFLRILWNNVTYASYYEG
jgi:type IV secretory pathway TrbD component